MLTIRLQRTGKKNNPAFRVVLAEKTSAASKKFVEVLGNYNPTSKQLGIKNQDRLNYWIAQHVELSPTVHNLLVTHKLLDAKKMQAFVIPKKLAEVNHDPAPAQTVPESVETQAAVLDAQPEGQAAE
jgi:small subunit ribosomal protein S16